MVRPSTRSLTALLMTRGTCCLHVTLLLTSLLHGATAAVIRRIPVDNDEPVISLRSSLPMLQQTLNLCPAGMDALDCFDGLISLYLRQGQTADERPNIRNKRTEDSNWRLCPRTMGRLECFERYVAMMIRTGDKKKRGLFARLDSIENRGEDKKRFPLSSSEQGSSMVPKQMRLNWRLCPNSQNKVGCFESYMAWWLHLAASSGGGGGDGGEGVQSDVTSVTPVQPGTVTWDEPMLDFEESADDKPKRGFQMDLGLFDKTPRALNKKKAQSEYLRKHSPGGAYAGCRTDEELLSCIVRRLNQLEHDTNIE